MPNFSHFHEKKNNNWPGTCLLSAIFTKQKMPWQVPLSAIFTKHQQKYPGTCLLLAIFTKQQQKVLWHVPTFSYFPETTTKSALACATFRHFHETTTKTVLARATFRHFHETTTKTVLARAYYFWPFSLVKINQNKLSPRLVLLKAARSAAAQLWFRVNQPTI